MIELTRSLGVVLMLRVYALYEKSKKVLIVLLLLFAMSLTYTLYQTFGGPKCQPYLPHTKVVL